MDKMEKATKDRAELVKGCERRVMANARMYYYMHCYITPKITDSGIFMTATSNSSEGEKFLEWLWIEKHEELIKMYGEVPMNLDQERKTPVRLKVKVHEGKNIKDILPESQGEELDLEGVIRKEKMKFMQFFVAAAYDYCNSDVGQ